MLVTIPPVIHVLSPDLVEITEQPETYQMTRAEVEEAIRNIKDRRHKYASDAAYLRRLEFFENILKSMTQAVPA